jgi:hypothetical protein
LLIHIFVGDRTEESCRSFLLILKARLGKIKPMFTSDELKSYRTILLELYSHKIEQPKTGKRGRPRGNQIVIDQDLDYATVHKTRVKGRVVKVEQRIVFGNKNRIEQRLKNSPSHTINTAFTERANGTLRQLDSHLRRKSLSFAKAYRFLKAKAHLIVACYNLVRPHGTLSCRTVPRTPAMAANLTDHPWVHSRLFATPLLQ